MACYALYETTTGRLRSLGSVVVDPVPDGMSVLLVGENPPDANVMWDEATRSFISRPAKVLVDRLQDFASQPGVVDFWQSLTNAQRVALRDALIKLLGPERWRNQNGNFEIWK